MESTMAASAIVFDKDGTLIDLHARWAPWIAGLCRAIADGCGDSAAVADLEAALGVSGARLVADSPAAVLTGADIRRVAVDAMAIRGHDRSRVATSVAEAYGSTAVGELVPLGEVATTMARLADRGFKLGIATSDDRANTLAELDELRIRSLMIGVRCGDDPGPGKPDPEVLFGLADELEVAPSELIFVGDSLVDMATAVAASVRFVAVVGGSSAEADLASHARALVPDISGLLSLLA